MTGLVTGEERSTGGGVIFTRGDGEAIARLPDSTELFAPLRLHDTAASDFDGLGELMPLGLPSAVPPEMVFVKLGVLGVFRYAVMSSSALNCPGVMRLPNLPPRAAVIGT